MSPLAKLVIVLVVLLLLFAVVVGLGLARDDSDSSSREQPPLLKKFGEKFLTKTMVQPREIWPQTDCFRGSTFMIRGGCVARIVSSDTRLRTLKLELQAGSRVKATLRSKGEQGSTVNAQLRAGGSLQKLELQVLAEGADLGLICEIPPPGMQTPCLVAVLPK